MEIFIELLPTEVKLFLNHVGHDSRLGRLILQSEFERVSIPWPMSAIRCSENDALRLLEIAKAQCPTSINRIRQGLREAGVSNHLMNILIELSRANIECLLSHLPLVSDLRQILSKSDATVFSNIRPTGSNPVVCDEGEARALLRIALEHCPEAVEKIQYGMNVAGVGYS